MEVKIVEKKEVPLLSRTRVTLVAVFEKETPKREEIRKEASKALGSDEKLTVIKHIYTRFGKPEAKIIAHIYKNEKEMMAIEDKITLAKHLGKEMEEKKDAKEGEAAKQEVIKEDVGQK